MSGDDDDDDDAVYLSIYPSIYLSIHPSIYLSIEGAWGGSSPALAFGDLMKALVNMGSKIDEKSKQKSMKVVSTIHQTSIKNQWKWGTWGRPGATLGVFGLMLVESDEFGPHFGLIFFTFSLQDGSWMVFGVDLGVKLGPS